jgi:hypothetical protein
MTDDQYKTFLQYLYQQYIEPRRHYLAPFTDPRRNGSFTLTQLRRAMQTVDYVNSHCRNDDEIYEIFRAEWFQGLANSVRVSLSSTRSLAEESGFLDAIEGHLEAIIDGLAVECVPAEELEALRYLGRADPQLELAGMILVLRARKEWVLQATKETRLRDLLHQAENLLAEDEKRIAELHQHAAPKADAPPKAEARIGRKWFSALGKICIGTGSALANILLVAATLPITPASGSAAIASTTLGFGTVLEGLGKLQGEA